MYSSVIPQFKDENQSLRERIVNMRGWAEAASKVRYMPDADIDAVLANLITQILLESDKIDELKPVVQNVPNIPDIKTKSDELFQMLSHTRNVAMDDAFQGFDFYENNPLKKKAEKKIAKIQKRKKG
jgi:hypothetical protein